VDAVAVGVAANVDEEAEDEAVAATLLGVTTNRSRIFASISRTVESVRARTATFPTAKKTTRRLDVATLQRGKQRLQSNARRESHIVLGNAF
jgi:hypothetical protein